MLTTCKVYGCFEKGCHAKAFSPFQCCTHLEVFMGNGGWLNPWSSVDNLIPSINISIYTCLRKG